MLIIGHRGAKGLKRENTVASLQAALDSKVDGIEFDVRTTKDNVAVLVHDPVIKSSDGKLVIANTTYKKLKEADQDLITLKEALGYINNRVSVVIEVKPRSAVKPVIITIQDSIAGVWDRDKISISSFDFRLLKKFKKAAPELRLIVNDPWSGVRASQRARRLGTKYITMNQKWLWRGFIKSVASSGYKLSAYTLNDPKKAQRWAKSGLYAVITDYPDRFNKF